MSTLSGLAGLMLAGAAMLTLAGCGGERHPGDVILITVDALRPDHLGLYGYPRETSPNLDRWLADAAVYRRAYTAAGQTAPSIPSLLSGLLPQEHGVRLIYQLLPGETLLIPDLLPPEYQTAAFVSSMVLTNEAGGLGQRFDHYDDFVTERESERETFERSAAATTAAASRWLRDGRDPARPLFMWVHYIDPHGPYDPPPDWRRTFTHPEPRPIDPERVSRYMRLPGVDDGMVYVDRYDEEIAYTDHHLDSLLRTYREVGDWERALLILTSDHGESMMEHERWFTHGYQVYEEIIRVPLVLRAPGVEPGARDGLVSTLDVAPTVLRFAGAQVPPRVGGIDLLAMTPPADRSVFAESWRGRAQWRAELRGHLKWTVRIGRRNGRIREQRLYHLARDPRELSPQPWTGESGPAPGLLELCRADPDPGGLPRHYLKGVRRTTPKVADRADDAALEGLRALGYLE